MVYLPPMVRGRHPGFLRYWADRQRNRYLEERAGTSPTTISVTIQHSIASSVVSTSGTQSASIKCRALVRKLSLLRVMGIGTIACLAIFYLWSRKTIRDAHPHEMRWQEHSRRLSTGETLRMERWDHGNDRFFVPYCRMHLDQEVLGPFIRERGLCDFGEPAELFRIGERRVLSTGAALFSKLDSEQTWNPWSAFGTDAPALLDHGIAVREELKVNRVWVRYLGSRPHVEMQVKAVGDPVLVFDGGEFDLDATLLRNPSLAVIPFPDNRVLESYSAAREVRQIVAGRWTATSIGGEQIRIRGAYGNRDRKLSTIYVQRPGTRYFALQLAMGEWHGGIGTASVRIQPRLPRGAATLKPTEILDPSAASEFVQVPNLLHSGPIVVSPDGRVMALLSPDGWNATAIFNAQSGTLMSSLRYKTRGHGQFRTAKISPDSAYIAALTTEAVTVLNTHSGEELATLSGAFSNMAFAGNGELVLAQGRTLEIRDVRVLSEVRAALPCNEGYISIDVSADGSRLAAGSWKGEVEIWNLPAGTPSRTLKVSSEQGNVAVLLSPDGRWLLASTPGPRNAIWDVETGTRTASVPGYPLGFSTGGGPAEVVMECGSGICGYRTNGSLVRQIVRPDSARPAGPDGRVLVFNDGRIMKWNPDDGKVEYVLTLIGRGTPAAAWPKDNPPIPVAEWIVVHPGSLFYSSSEGGDEYAYLRFGPYLTGLREYRTRFRR
jgi:WD40 repeat protein